ncbi:MAG: gluconolaconase [Pseudomonadota bacterium]
MNRQSNRIKAASLAALAVAAALGVWQWRSGGEAPLARIAALAHKAPATVMGWPVAIADAGSGFADPFGVVLDRAGNLYVADAGDHNQIVRIVAGGARTVLAGQGEGFADGTGAAAKFNTPSGMAFDPAGNLIVADTGNHAIRRISMAGVVTTLAGTGAPGNQDGPGLQAQFNGPVGVAVDNAGNVYVADTYNDRIRKIAPDGSVSTLAGGAAPGYADGMGAAALFDTPTGIALDAKGTLYIADTQNSAIRTLALDGQVGTLARSDPQDDTALLRRPLALALTTDGYVYVGDMARGRILQVAPTGELRGLTGIGIDIEIGDSGSVRFSRPAGIALDRHGALLVADASARVVRKVSPRAADAPPSVARVAPPAPARSGSFPWPFAPQNVRHEVVGIVGEVRGSYDGESRDHFHNGLDIQADMGVPVLAVADEKVASPSPNWAFDGLGEGMSVDGFAYVHMRVGRTIRNAPLDAERFTILTDEKGKPCRVRVRRGTRFHVGDKLGTVNRMFHVHLIERLPGGEGNAMTLPFPGLQDTVTPHIVAIQLMDQANQRLLAKQGKRLLVTRAGGPLSIVVDAYDQTDGNAKRRKLGLYKLGYQLLAADGTPLAGFEAPLMNIEFNRLPPDQESVKVAYAPNSGITVYGNATTRFLYVVTNRVRDGEAVSGNWDPAPLAPGDYIIRIFAADFAGNEVIAGRDLAITVQ